MNRPKEYNGFEVKTVGVKNYPKFKVSKIQVRGQGENDTREINHWWYEQWPDQGVPKVASILEFDRRVQSEQREADTSPILVHCSAGVGRAGTFVAINGY